MTVHWVPSLGIALISVFVFLLLLIFAGRNHRESSIPVGRIVRQVAAAGFLLLFLGFFGVLGIRILAHYLMQA